MIDEKRVKNTFFLNCIVFDLEVIVFNKRSK